MDRSPAEEHLAELVSEFLTEHFKGLPGEIAALLDKARELPKEINDDAEMGKAAVLIKAFREITIAATIGIVLTAAYMLWTLQRLFLGTLPEKWKTLPDINGRELFMLVPLAVIVIFLGLYPAPMIDLMAASVNTLVGVIRPENGMALIGH